jgi:rsbT co-antagonist protein RsbR
LSSSNETGALVNDQPSETIESLRVALAAAQTRATHAIEHAAALSSQIERMQDERRALHDQERRSRRRLNDFLGNFPGIVWENYFVQDPEAGRVSSVAGIVESLSGYTAADWVQPNFWSEIIHPEDRELGKAASEYLMIHGRGSSSYRLVAKDGRVVWVTAQMSVIHDEADVPIGLRGITLDITEQKEAEAERNEALLREGVLRAQQDSLLELATPLVPIDDDVLAMTLVGGLDESRADRVLTTLLDGVARSGARVVILDVTGVLSIDTQTADTLIRAARSVSLLGAEVVLTGIRAEVARTLVDIGVDLGSIMTKSTLKAGIAHALQATGGLR